MNLVVGASWCFTLTGIALGIAALAVFRRPMPALRVTMDLLVTASLLLLSVDLSWTAIAGTAVLIVVRRLLTLSLTADFRAAQHRVSS
ncbi:MAG: hypothetical protein K0U76_05565 [Actinomycetia bacterium]|nr:hypothetical protein [Actinomycetes bacterium]MCH9700845.1 hypothetical protein [Actinomycetes bacterium]MCH9760664.1 hypothetical protein [Actinomycetes bacterium]